MFSYNLSLVLAFVTLLLGVYFEQIWMGIALAIVIFVMLTFAKPKPRPKPVPPPAPEQVVIQGVPEYPSNIMDFYKRGAKPGKPLFIQTVPYKPPLIESLFKGIASWTALFFRAIGHLMYREPPKKK